ncbi:DUF1129 family protein [Bacillus sp. FJAT-50079]|uniref:HAAS domain-containing protein n=1 Tax=Bacillus sp. FJAT-50079 TaxID=2833577 RepID=UPI001BC9D6D7|nr:DUF1129 family protein [Bacillus sp. FJAT-50079]MBS4210344.1 DUF1129 family protein [Bacillus sp. FJAT-50079]
MLTKKSETFLENLRLYLMTSGKNETEIKELTGELRDHLIESEKRGKNIEEIIGCTPEQYMATLKKEMKTDYKSIMKYLPIYFFGAIAYMLMGPAIRNEFALNMIQVIGLPIVILLGFIIYVIFLQKAGKRQYSTKRFFLVGMIAYSIVAVLFLLLLMGSALIVEPFYRGGDFANWTVVVICSCIFIATAIWSKVWFPIWIPAVLFIPDLLFRFSNLKDETILWIQAASFVLLFILIILSMYITEKSKKRKQIMV